MLIGEAAKRCGITKKAIGYYEQQGLIDMKYNGSGYRYYTEQDVSRLKEITIFRKLGMSVAEIKEVIGSEDKYRVLSEYRMRKRMHMMQLQAEDRFLAYLLEQRPSIEQAFEVLDTRLDAGMTIKEKLLLAFPGSYGRYLVIHFGRFLNEPLDSLDKIEAYQAVVDFLDQAKEMEPSEELLSWMEEAFETWTDRALEQIEHAIDTALNDFEQFMETKQDMLAEYVAYQQSEAYQSSPAHRLKSLLLEFQQQSGYHEIFIPNLKRLSASYRQYQEKLQAANELWMTRYPPQE
ncbi:MULTISPECIES: MerR family transcriptional regulator [Paenibacillus]|uniref:MerR family transcriptional regulator n=1 Tax=Paenibacillus TaxID=44249 RepID=UPI00048A4FF4|nr:MerR family transcriptional regulator [Paenibacillus sp. IHBB 10380]